MTRKESHRRKWISMTFSACAYDTFAAGVFLNLKICNVLLCFNHGHNSTLQHLQLIYISHIRHAALSDMESVPYCRQSAWHITPCQVIRTTSVMELWNRPTLTHHPNSIQRKEGWHLNCTPSHRAVFYTLSTSASSIIGMSWHLNVVVRLKRNHCNTLQHVKVPYVLHIGDEALSDMESVPYWWQSALNITLWERIRRTSIKELGHRQKCHTQPKRHHTKTRPTFKLHTK